jgi:uncharacterized membrane protein
MFNWIKRAFFMGLILLVTLALLWVVLRELFELLLAIVQSIVDFLPPETLSWIEAQELVAPILILLVAFIFGALASIPNVRKTGARLEGETLGHLPVYRMIRTFVTAFLEVEDASSFGSALVLDDKGGAEPCYIIDESEDHPNVLVLVPWSPASAAGTIRLVPRQRIQHLTLTFEEFSLGLANFGLGANSIVKLRSSLKKTEES